MSIHDESHGAARLPGAAIMGLSDAIAATSTKMARRVEGELYGTLADTAASVRPMLAPSHIKDIINHPMFIHEMKEMIYDTLNNFEKIKLEKQNLAIQRCRFANVIYKISQQKIEPPSFADLLMGL